MTGVLGAVVSMVNALESADSLPAASVSRTMYSVGECVAAEINGVGAAGFADGVIAGVNENASGGVDLECGAGFPGDGEDLCVVVGD